MRVSNRQGERETKKKTSHKKSARALSSCRLSRRLGGRPRPSLFFFLALRRLFFGQDDTAQRGRRRRTRRRRTQKTQSYSCCCCYSRAHAPKQINKETQKNSFFYKPLLRLFANAGGDRGGLPGARRLRLAGETPPLFGLPRFC